MEVPLSNVLIRQVLAASPTVPAKAPTTTNSVRRAGVLLKNSSGANDLWIVHQPESDDATPPTITADDNDVVLGPGETLVFDIKSTTSIWVQSSAGTHNYTAMEFE